MSFDAATGIHRLFSGAVAAAHVDPGLAGTITRLLCETEAAEDVAGSPTLLPFLSCGAAGGDAGQALPVAAAWRGLHVASKLIDDVEDGDADRLRSGPGASARLVNLGTGLYAASILCLSELPIALYRELTPLFHRTILCMVGGQHRELEAGEGDGPDICLAVIDAKAGSFFALGAEAGARCAAKGGPIIGEMREFGHNAGMMVQLANDLEGFRESGSNGDLWNGRRTLPVMYSLSAATPIERRELERLLARAVRDAEAESGARQLMIELGAETYMALQLARHRRRALDTLTGSDDCLAPLRQWLHALSTRMQGIVSESGASGRAVTEFE